MVRVSIERTTARDVTVSVRRGDVAEERSGEAGRARGSVGAGTSCSARCAISWNPPALASAAARERYRSRAAASLTTANASAISDECARVLVRLPRAHDIAFRLAGDTMQNLLVAKLCSSDGSAAERGETDAGKVGQCDRASAPRSAATG